jgi:hypothetical protein
MALAIVLVVRVYDPGTLNTHDRLEAAATAAAILQTSGITSDWIDCSSPGANGPGGQAARCSSPIGPGGIAVRLVRGSATSPGARSIPLGDALVDAAHLTGALATVYVDRVQRIAAEAQVDATTLLGRAVAHEIGHLLLGTSHHSGKGLMRADWSRGTLLRNVPADWLFTPQESLALRRGLGRRAASADGR